MNNNFHFFWGGPFSQWYPSYFTVEGVNYNCAEQYMMAQKAIFFGDSKRLVDILNSKSPSKIKEFGRLVRNFNPEHWNAVCKDIVYTGNKAKFEQNLGIRNILFNTAPKTLVEASPYDKKWGIGIHMNDARAKDPKQWLGTNWLGEILTKLRTDLLTN